MADQKPAAPVEPVPDPDEDDLDELDGTASLLLPPRLARPRAHEGLRSGSANREIDRRARRILSHKPEPT
jgi:hypothetical protein